MQLDVGLTHRDLLSALNCRLLYCKNGNCIQAVAIVDLYAGSDNEPSCKRSNIKTFYSQTGFTRAFVNRSGPSTVNGVIETSGNVISEGLCYVGHERVSIVAVESVSVLVV